MNTEPGPDRRASTGASAQANNAFERLVNTRAMAGPLGIDMSAHALSWPSEEAASTPGSFGNRLYVDVRGIDWEAAERLMVLERRNLWSYAAAVEGDEIERDHLKAHWGEWCEFAPGFDLGVVGCVAAISAAGGIPTTSCNGGVLGGVSEALRHSEPYPVIAFFWRREVLEPLLKCVRRTGLSAWIHEGQQSRGQIVIAADCLKPVLNFARCLHGNRDMFEKWRSRSLDNARPRHRGSSLDRGRDIWTGR